MVRFLFGGVAGVSAYFGTLYVLTEYVHVWYIGSAVVAWILNWAINFAVQKYWTFRDRDQSSIRRQLVMYYGMALSFLIGGTALLYVLVEWVHLWYMTAQIILSCLFTPVSFVISRRLFAR